MENKTKLNEKITALEPIIKGHLYLQKKTSLKETVNIYKKTYQNLLIKKKVEI